MELAVSAHPFNDQFALLLFRHTLVESVRGEAPDLSARQLALMLIVYLESGPHTVRGLAALLKISKPAISRALDRLGELGYVKRKRDELDRRNVHVQCTQKGTHFLAELADTINRAGETVLVQKNSSYDELSETDRAQNSAFQTQWTEAAE